MLYLMLNLSPESLGEIGPKNKVGESFSCNVSKPNVRTPYEGPNMWDSRIS